MSNKDTEKIFQFVFFLAIIVMIIIIIGFFLLGVKFSLNFVPEVNLLGVKMINP